MEILDILLTVNFWAAAIRIATPLIFGVLGALLCERAGVLNLGIEGIFTAGAMAGWMAVWMGCGLWTGVLFAALAVAAGCAAVVYFKINYIEAVSGTTYAGLRISTGGGSTISTLLGVLPGQFHRITGIPQVNEINAFNGPAILNIQAGYNAFGNQLKRN